jgi:hypothetical protein
MYEKTQKPSYHQYENKRNNLHPKEPMFPATWDKYTQKSFLVRNRSMHQKKYYSCSKYTHCSIKKSSPIIEYLYS